MGPQWQLTQDKAGSGHGPSPITPAGPAPVGWTPARGGQPTGIADVRHVAARASDPLPHRRRLESSFGADLSDIRTDASAASTLALTEGMAHAAALPYRILFDRADPDIETVAHEVTHVLQQRRGGAASIWASEHEADDLGRAAAGGQQVRVVQGTRADVPQFLMWRNVMSAPAISHDHALLTAARQTGDWQQVAEELNGLSHQEMQFRLADLSHVEVGYLHLGAIDNPRLGAESAIALETAPGRPRVSTAEPGEPQKRQHGPGETIAGFRQQIRTVAADRLTANGQNLRLWRDFLDFELSPEQLMSQTLTMEARQLRVDAAKGGTQTRELANQWSHTNNPLQRELLEHNIHGQWRACTGCHVSNQAWALTPQDTRSWQTPIQQMATVDPSGRTHGIGPRSAAEDSTGELDTRLARVAPFLQELGPLGYKVLPSNEFGRNRSPAELRRAVDQAVTQRMADYQLLASRILSGQVDYRELRPVIDELLPHASAQVRASVDQELEDFDTEHSRTDTLAQIAGIALLLLVVFPPTSLFAIGVGAAAGTALAVTGSARYDRGKDLQLAAGARDVVDPALQGQADAMVVGGVMDMISGALAIAGAITGLRARIQSEGRLGTLAVQAGSTVTEAEFTVTFAADGQSYVVTSRQHPGCFVIVDADGATGFVMQNGNTVKVGHRPWIQTEASPVTSAQSAATAPGTRRLALPAPQTPRIQISTGGFKSNPTPQASFPAPAPASAPSGVDYQQLPFAKLQNTAAADLKAVDELVRRNSLRIVEPEPLGGAKATMPYAELQGLERENAWAAEELARRSARLETTLKAYRVAQAAKILPDTGRPVGMRGAQGSLQTRSRTVGGTLAVAETDVAQLSAEFRGASPEAGGPRLPKSGPESSFTPDNLDPRGIGHAEERILAAIDKEIEAAKVAGALDDAKLAGRTVRMQVEDLPCSSCMAGVGHTHTVGPLVKFLNKYPGMRLVVSDIFSGRTVIMTRAADGTISVVAQGPRSF